MFKQPAMSDKLQFVAESLIQSFGNRRQIEVCHRVVDPRFQERTQCLIGSARYTRLVQQAVLRWSARVVQSGSSEDSPGVHAKLKMVDGDVSNWLTPRYSSGLDARRL